MRVIAGVARRINLTAPEGLSTRPTADRAKESLFNILGTKVKNARFLDIFCGSGAIGIEALSRGAKEAVFVDAEQPAIKALRENLAKTKLESMAEILQMHAEKALEKLMAQKRCFDVIFMDPPYDSPLLSKILKVILSSNLTAPDAVVIAETRRQNDFFPQETVIKTEARIYGLTKFIIIRNEGC
ncbi:MAG: 16S rRNA (guanine(966)-N(2))-methyltransferase RsmD [Defluviitaleaceae bacterium]|nr:16S rRNA (guanine(966)-N(2))-methyltransferase RsmD [Defluviitaleaceae bacterium]